MEKFMISHEKLPSKQANNLQKRRTNFFKQQSLSVLKYKRFSVYVGE